jgi:serine/threonine-protein kinase
MTMHAPRLLRRARHLFFATALAASITGASASSFAADPAAAQALFDSAKRLMNDGRYAEACPKLEESERLDSGTGTLFQLAVCYEHVGRTASAWAAFVEVAGRAKAAGQKAREKAARDRANALEPTLPRLVIGARARGTDAIAGLEITRDGEPVGSGQWGTPVPVDPGEHRIVATAPGHKTWQTTVTVRGDGKIVSVVIPRLEEEVAPPPAPPPPPPPTPAPVATTQPIAQPSRPAPLAPVGPVSTVDQNRGSGQRAAGGVILGLGLASIATGAGFVIGSKAANDASSSHCNASNVCDATGVQRRDDARRYGDVATIALGAGAALFLGGVITYFTAPSSTPDTIAKTSRRAEIAPMIGPGVSGLRIGGSF